MCSSRKALSILYLSKLREMVKDREAWLAAVHWVTKSQTRLSHRTTTFEHTRTFHMLSDNTAILRTKGEGRGKTQSWVRRGTLVLLRPLPHCGFCRMSKALGHNFLVNRTKIASLFVTEQTYSAVRLQMTMWHFIVWGIIIMFSFKSWTWRSKAEGRSGFGLFCHMESPVCTHPGQLFTAPMDCGPPDSSVLGIFQARILEWVAIRIPGDLPHPGIEPSSLVSPALAFTTSATWEALGISYFRAVIGSMENLCTVWKLPEWTNRILFRQPLPIYHTLTLI